MKIRYVDFDGCLAYFDSWKGSLHLGEPVPEMVKKVKEWVSQGDLVIVYTARMTPEEGFGLTQDVETTRKAIEQWCLDKIGLKLHVTNIKSYADIYYDDRCCRVIQNTGLTLEQEIVRIIGQQLDSNSSKEESLSKIMTFLKEVGNDI